MIYGWEDDLVEHWMSIMFCFLLEGVDNWSALWGIALQGTSIANTAASLVLVWSCLKRTDQWQITRQWVYMTFVNSVSKNACFLDLMITY